MHKEVRCRDTWWLHECVRICSVMSGVGPILLVQRWILQPLEPLQPTSRKREMLASWEQQFPASPQGGLMAPHYLEHPSAAPVAAGQAGMSLVAECRLAILREGKNGHFGLPQKLM